MNDNFVSLSGNLFSLQSFTCKTLIDTTHTDEGIEKNAFRIQTSENPILYAYAPSSGLVMLNRKTGSISEADILGKLLSLPLNSPKAIANFFDSHGFFIATSSETFDMFNFEFIQRILRHMKFTINLIADIESASPNYDNILKRALYLYFDTPIQLNSGCQEYKTCSHPLLDAFNNWDKFRECDDFFCNTHDQETSFYSIPDTFTNTENKVSSWDYMIEQHEASDSGEMSFFMITKHIYLKYHYDLPDGFRETIDFLYHYQQDFQEIIIDGDSKLSNIILKNKKINDNVDNITTSIYASIIKFAKRAIKEELEWNLNYVSPIYDIDTMSASWFIPDFISALYFSIFYLQPEQELYRKCANTNCSNFFPVKTTNHKKKYCCRECSNAMSQRGFRNRKSKKEVEVSSI